MDIEGQVVLVTGSNRGIGRRFVDGLLARGAAKVYATARRPESFDETLRSDDRVVLLPLDITDPASIEAVAEAAPDVTVLINNAGISTGADLVSGDLDAVRREFDTHFWGTLGMVRAFAPGIAVRDGAIVNVLSALSWFSWTGTGGYSAAKAAEWALTNGVRVELAPRGVQVVGVHLGAADTDITAGYDGPKIDPDDVVTATLASLESGGVEVLVDDWSRTTKAALALDPAESPLYDGMLTPTR